MFPILTSVTGDNSDLFPLVLELYANEGDSIADVTYGRGVFWKKVDLERYSVFFSDLDAEGAIKADFTSLPYPNQNMDMLILDPPYMHSGEGIKESINKCYKNRNASHFDVIRRYTRGILEASRVLVKKGKLVLKVQDEIESGRQCLSHVELINILELLGFRILDLFVLVQKTIPCMRNAYQLTARKNHSYFIVCEVR